MFRPMRRSKQQLTREECDQVLNACMRGVMAFLGDDDYPYAVPLDYAYDVAAGKLYSHGAREGHKVDAMRAHDKASFCVMDEGCRVEGKFGLNIRSVICFGRLRQVEPGEATIAAVRKLGMRYLGSVYPTEEDVEREIASAGKRVFCYELDIEHMTGKLVNES